MSLVKTYFDIIEYEGMYYPVITNRFLCFNWYKYLWFYGTTRYYSIYLDMIEDKLGFIEKYNKLPLYDKLRLNRPLIIKTDNQVIGSKYSTFAECKEAMRYIKDHADNIIEL